MTEYAEVATSDYLSNLEKWHRDTSWICYGNAVLFLYTKLPPVLMAMKKEMCLSRAKTKKMFFSDLSRISYAAEEYRRI